MRAGLKSNIVRLAGFGAVLQVANVAILLMTTALLSRMLGVAAFGEYVLVLTVVTLAGIVTVFGLPTFLTREIAAGLVGTVHAGEGFDPRRLVRNALLTSLALFAGFAAGLAAVAGLWPALIPSPVGIAPLGLMLGRAMLEIHAGALIGQGRIRQGQAATLLLMNGPFLVLLATVPRLSAGELTVGGVFRLQAAGIWLGAVLAAVWAWRGLARLPAARGGRAAWRGAIRACVPLALVNGLAAFQQNVVFLVLGGLMSPADVGVYRIAERISAVTQFLRAAFRSVLEPTVSRSWRAGTLAETAIVLRRVCLANTVFTAAVLGVFAVAGRDVISLVFGGQAAAAWEPLMILLTGFAAAAAFGFNGMVLSMTLHADRVLRTLVVTFAVLCVLLLAFTLALGSVGAAVAGAIYTVLTAGLLWRSARAVTGVDISIIRW